MMQVPEIFGSAWRSAPVFAVIAAFGLVNAAIAGATSATQASTAQSQKSAMEAMFPPVRTRVLETRDVHSASGLAFRLFISKPQGAPPARGFPVIYVLDANAWFGTMVELVRLEEPADGPAVVVGIGYPTQSLFDLPRRVFDYTPLIPPAEMEDLAALKTGGAADFIRFMLDEVKPGIEHELPVDRGREAIFGHSLSGRLVVQLLFTHPESFETYIAASPALHVYPKQLREWEAQFLQRKDRPRNVRILLTAGLLEQFPDEAHQTQLRAMLTAHPQLLQGRNVDAVLADMQADAQKLRMVDNAKELAERLTRAGVKAQFAAFPGEEHLSAAPVAINRGVGFALRATP